MSLLAPFTDVLLQINTAIFLWIVQCFVVAEGTFGKHLAPALPSAGLVLSRTSRQICLPARAEEAQVLCVTHYNVWPQLFWSFFPPGAPFAAICAHFPASLFVFFFTISKLRVLNARHLLKLTSAQHLTVLPLKHSFQFCKTLRTFQGFLLHTGLFWFIKPTYW